MSDRGTSFEGRKREASKQAMSSTELQAIASQLERIGRGREDGRFWGMAKVCRLLTGYKNDGRGSHVPVAVIDMTVGEFLDRLDGLEETDRQEILAGMADGPSVARRDA